MEDKVNNYLVQLTNYELSETESKTITHYLKLTSEFERVGDYTINVVELAERLYEKQMTFSEKAQGELQAISEAVDEIIGMAIQSFTENSTEIAEKIEPLEETIDTMEDTLKFRHIERLKNGKCAIESGLIFLEILANLERISDHCSNIAVYIIGINNNRESLNRHEYLKRIHNNDTGEFKENVEIYNKKYFKRIER